MEILKEIELLTALANILKQTKDLGAKQEKLIEYPKVKKSLELGLLQPFFPFQKDLSTKIALLALAAIGQEKKVLFYPTKDLPKEKVRNLLTILVAVDRFYENIGGIVGYHVKILKFIHDKERPDEAQFSEPCGIDLTTSREAIFKATLAGIGALEQMGEIYPIGGLGSRLDLKSKKGEPLPAACLPFCGRTLLEGLIRDVQAREFLYYKLFGTQVTVPIAMMTSFEKHNSKRVHAICEKKGWFGRPKESFCLFSQLSVPVVTEEGNWAMKAPLEMHLQPGGHGALWRTAEEEGVFFWFQKQEKRSVLVRQINNPIGGIDLGLLALVGIGFQKNKALGFASCHRKTQAAEGALVLRHKNGHIALCNVEYTDFKRYGIEDVQAASGYSSYPANTNILYVDLQKILPKIKQNPLPGLMLNIKSTITDYLSDGSKKEVKGGRLESMMQNISENFWAPTLSELPTFYTFNKRNKTISATKKSWEPFKPLLETPEGVFYDMLSNAYDLLKNHCRMDMPPFSSTEEYLSEGPSLIFLYHPALGPLYSMIEQKIKGGSIAWGGELRLEIAEAMIKNLNLQGSLLIEAENLLGHRSQGIIRYSNRTGKCFLEDVTVSNLGLNRNLSIPYWKNHYKRHEALRVILKGHSEFWAKGVAFEGNQTFVVPDGERWICFQEEGKIEIYKEKADSVWNYSYSDESIQLQIEDKLLSIPSLQEK